MPGASRWVFCFKTRLCNLHFTHFLFSYKVLRKSPHQNFIQTTSSTFFFKGSTMRFVKVQISWQILFLVFSHNQSLSQTVGKKKWENQFYLLQLQEINSMEYSALLDCIWIIKWKTFYPFGLFIECGLLHYTVNWKILGELFNHYQGSFSKRPPLLL